MKPPKVVLVILLATVAAACTQAPREGNPVTSSPTPQSRPLKVEKLERFAPGDAFVRSLRIWENYLAWIAEDEEPTPRNRIVVYDLRTKKKRVVARATTPTAQIDTVIGDRDTLIYSELARTPDTFTEKGMNVPWSEYLVDLKTGARRKILSFRNEDRFGPLLPHPSFEWPWVIETLPGGNGTLDVMGYDVRSNEWKTILPDIQLGSSFHIDEGFVFYRARSGGERTTKTSDLLSAPVDGSAEPQRLTSSGVVEGLTTANGASTWHEPIDGDPMSLWWLPHNRAAKPIRFHDDGGYGPYPGNGFVAWIPIEGGGLLVQDPTASGPLTELSGEDLNLGARWVAFDDRIVWATRTDEKAPIEIHVARISRG